MSLTHSTAAQNAATDGVCNLLSAAGSKLVFRVGGTLASPGAAAATLGMGTPAFGASAGGVATANAITTDGNATGNAAAVSKASLETSGGTRHIYADVGVVVSTTVSGASGDNAITVGSATGIVAGMAVSGTGIAAGAKVAHVSGTTVSLTIENTGAVSGTGTFTPDIAMSNGLVISAGDSVSCSSLSYQALVG